MTKEDLSLKGLSLVHAKDHSDDRGFFSELWRSDIGFPEFKQMNTSVSKVCTFRGLHYQWDRPQGKLIKVTKGKALFFELDIRTYSDTFGKHERVLLDSTMNTWLWVPAGFANGFFTLEPDTHVIYMCTENWSKNEGCIHNSVLEYRFNLLGGIRHISEKDMKAPSFKGCIEHLESISEFFSNDTKGVVEIDA